jgi:16S rRNA (guanine(527)-N(7))-methyltransferase RsmG
MFTKRHEQELAEIRALYEALDRRTREALERIKRIKEADFDGGHRASAAHHRAEERSPESVRTCIGEEVETLAARYELARESTDALHGLVELLDLERPNFVPQSTPTSDEPDRRRPLAAARHIVSSALAESLSGLELEPVRGARRIADIGSGAGFPGLVLAIALREPRVTLIERIGDKCGFLRRASAELGLENVEVIEGNVQEWSEEGTCDLVTSRKVGRPETVIRWSAPLLAPGGALALWPGRTDFEDGVSADATDATALQLAQVHRIPSVNRHGERGVKRLYLFR